MSESKTALKEFVLRIVFFCTEMDYRYNDWKHFTCDTDLRKRHKSQILQCQWADEDDLLSKSVLELFFA